jgi:hypothetical protein
MSLPTLLVALALLLVSAPGASAQAPSQNLPKPSDPAFLVPAGKVEHTVTTVRVVGSNAVPRHERIELWMTRDRTRNVITDVRTGKVVREITYRPGESRVYDAEKQTVTVMKERGTTTPPWNSFLFEAAVQKAYIEQGITRVTGETTVRGRRALQVESVPGKWRSDDPSSRTTATVDAETFVLYERSTGVPNGEYRQTETYDVFEQLDATGAVTARMAMGVHKGAKVKRPKRKA